MDGTGRTIMSRRYKAGEADEVTGKGPFAVVVGNAASTRMAVNGREFDLAPHTRATVARVTVK
jgi:cytoskeleton protein RodZ